MEMEEQEKEEAVAARAKTKAERARKVGEEVQGSAESKVCSELPSNF